jgi:hypothetical protein
MERSLFMVVLALGLMLPALTAEATNDVPTSERLADIRVVGSPLLSVLSELGESYNVRLSAVPSLQSQRVSLFARQERLEVLAKGLVELLSPAPDAGVSWREVRPGEWRLSESLNRRRLRQSLQNAELAAFEAYLSELSERARQAAETNETEILTDNVEQRRLAEGLLLDAMGPEARHAVVHGGWWARRIGDLDDLARRNLVEELGRTYSGGRGQFETNWIVIYRYRDPLSPGRLRLNRSLILPTGRSGARGTMQQWQGVRRTPLPFMVWQPPRTDPDEHPQVSLNLTPDAEARAEDRRPWVLDALLERVAAASGCTIVADGYRRELRVFPANLRLDSFPLEPLLGSLTRLWGCDWWYLSGSSSQVLVRAHAWWAEDAADLPDEVFQRLETAFSGEHPLDLPNLLTFAELSDAQALRLISGGVTPGAVGLLNPWFLEEGNGKRCLQFFNRLSPPLQQAALSQDGLPLDQVPPALVDQWLGLLLAIRGAVTPEWRRGLTFFIQYESPAWMIRLVRSGEDRPLFEEGVAAGRFSILPGLQPPPMALGEPPTD